MQNSPITHNTHNRGNGLVRLADFVLAHRRRVMLFWVIMLVVGFVASGFVTDRLTMNWSLPGQPGYETSKKIAQQYGNGGDAGNSVLVVTMPEDRTIASDQTTISAAFDKLRQQYPQIRVVDYFSTGEKELITKDNKTTYAYLFAPFPENFNALPISNDVAKSLNESIPGANVTATGAGELSISESDDQGVGVLVETIIAALGALIVLLYVFGSALALIPLMVAAVAILTTLSIILGVTYVADVSFVVQFLVSLVGLGVAIDYSLLIVTRWREEISKGAENNDAIRTSMATAGHAVLLSGMTVAIGLLALVVLPVPDLRSVGYGGMLIPLVSTAVVLTLLPAMLSGFGRKLNWPRVRHEERPSRGWTKWAQLIVKHRVLATVASSVALLVLIVPVFDLKIGVTNSQSLARSGEAYDAFKLLTNDGVPTGILTPMEVLTSQASAPQVAQALREVKGVESVVMSTAPDSNKNGNTILLAIPNVETVNSSTTQSVEDARAATENIPGIVGITGSGAVQLDYLDAVFGNAPLVFAIISILTFLLLVRAFHSVLLAVKALVLNVLSLAAIFGVLTWFWQQGHGSEPMFDIAATGAITFWIPTMVFAFLFGLSMDYEVFILARMREEYDRSGSTTEAVVIGLGRTGRLVTSAALILFMSFASLALAGFTDLKVLATGLGAGILLDATLVRAFLLPALVALFGKWNWWMPQSLATILRTEVPSKVPSTQGSEPSPA